MYPFLVQFAANEAASMRTPTDPGEFEIFMEAFEPETGGFSWQRDLR